MEQPVVAVCGGSDGGDIVRNFPTVMASVRELVKYGYAVLSITYFDPAGREKDVPRELNRIPLEYFENVFDWVQIQPDLKANTLAIYGSSRGAELALLLASKYDIIDLVVAGVPSSYVWGSYRMKYSYPYQHISYNSGHNVYGKSSHDVFKFIQSHYPVN